MRLIRAIPIGLAVAMLAACGEPKIDGATDQSFKSSMEKIVKGMDPGQRDKLEKDVMTIALADISFADIMSGKITADQQIGKVRGQLDGKTAEQVSGIADRVRADREAKEKAQALKEIKDLQDKKASAEKDKEQLSKFEVLTSRFSLNDREYSSIKQPIIYLAVKNGTSVAVSRAYFKGTIASPGRAIPWFTDTFNYKIRGGLEPGESADWSLEPNMFSDWGKVDAPKDAVFTVEVVRIDGPDEKAVYTAEGLSSSENERLESLAKKYLSN